MTNHRNEERDEHRSSSRHIRQEPQHTTTQRTQYVLQPRHNIDRYSLPINHLRAGMNRKVLDYFIQLNIQKQV
jgi:hypothetical protein